MRNKTLLIHSQIIKSNKSTFFVEILEHSSGQKYVSVEQVVHINNISQHSEKIRINPLVLEDVIEALMEMETKLANRKREKAFSRKVQQEIIRRYLIGVEIQDLTLQFDCDESAIKKVLWLNNVEIVRQQPPKHLRWRKKNKK